MRCAAASSPPRNCMPTTHRCRCWHPAMARPVRRGRGPVCATSAPAAMRRRQRSGSPSRLTARASIREATYPISMERCRPIPVPALTPCTKAVAFRKLRAEHTYAVLSVTRTRHGRHRSPQRRCAGSACCMPSKRMSKASLRTNAVRLAGLARNRFSTTWSAGWMPRAPRCRANPIIRAALQGNEKDHRALPR